jgi:hypothetical protein
MNWPNLRKDAIEMVKSEMWRKKRKVSALFFPFIFVGRAVAK